jgi:hypothetical protein
MVQEEVLRIEMRRSPDSTVAMLQMFRPHLPQMTRQLDFVQLAAIASLTAEMKMVMRLKC